MSDQDKNSHKNRIKRAGDINRLKKKVKENERNIRALLATRSIDSDIDLSDVGQLRIRIHQYSSFETGKIWDLREIKADGDSSQFCAFLNIIGENSTILPGYSLIDMTSIEIKKIVRFITKINIQLDYQDTTYAGLDGSIFAVTIYSNFKTKKHIEWWENIDSQLHEISSFIKYTIDLFENSTLLPLTKERYKL